MALTVQQLLTAVRLPAAGNTERVTRYQHATLAYLDQTTENLPENIRDVAVEMAVGWMADRPQASSGRQAYSDMFQQSGINALISPWRVSRLLPAKNIEEVGP